MNLTVSCTSGAGAIGQLRAAWQALMQADDEAGLFQAVEMCEAWHADAGLDAAQLRLLLVQHDEQPVGLLPLLEQGGATRRWVSASPRAGLLACGDRDAVCRALAGWLQRQAGRWDQLLLDDLRPAAARRLQAALMQHGLATEPGRPGGEEAFIRTDGGWAGYLATQGPHFRHRLKPQTRKIERLGPVSCRRDAGPQAASAYDEFLRLEPRSWKAAQDDTRLPERERLAFRWLIEHPGSVQPDLLFLDVAGQPAAAMLSLAHAGTYHLFVTYFDDALRAWYPGRRLFLEAIQHGFALPGTVEISFVGAYPFARAWATGVRSHVQLQAWSCSWRGRLRRWASTRQAPLEPTRPPPVTLPVPQQEQPHA